MLFHRGTRPTHDDVITLFAFEKINEEVKVLMEWHYKLVDADELTPEDLAAYRQHTRCQAKKRST